MRIGMIHSTIRIDEKLLMEAGNARGIDVVPVDIRTQILNPSTWSDKYDVVLERCISTTAGMHAIAFFESIGVPVVNSLSVANICVDKFATSLRLQQQGVPTIPFAMVFTEAEALTAIEQLGGFPVVIKPPTGSWGRLLAKVNDADSLEAILEHKSVLGSAPHKAFYIQKFIQKPDRDIRVTMVGGKVLCAIYRETKHWISNTARGAVATVCEVDKELNDICVATSDAVGGGVLGVDVMECDGKYIINEVNHTTEFKNVQRITGVDVAGSILDYCQERSKSHD